ncbi:MAG: tetratricopeptide repeat protein [Bdellovibrionota bacterium]
MLGFQGVSYFKRAQIRALQEEYQDAEDEFHELVFAEKNPREPLSGLVFLNAGDRAYNEGQFEESKGYYEKALVPLKKTPLNGRAQMALALGAYRAGHVDQAEAKLNAILNEKSFLASVRAEAGYQLALLALESGDENRAQEYLASVSKLPSTGVWAQKAILLAGLIPEVMG